MATARSSPTGPALDRFFETLRRSPVKRSQDRVIAGVAAGLADRLGVASGVIRVAFVALGVLGLGVPLYLVAWLLVPDGQGRIRLEAALRESEASSIVLLVVTILSVFSTVFGRGWELRAGMPGMPGMYGNGVGLWLVLLAVPVFVVIVVRERAARRRDRREHADDLHGDQEPPQDAPRP